MFTQRLARPDICFSAVMAALLLLTTSGQSATVNDTNNTTASPALTTQLSNSSAEEPLVLSFHRPCGDEHPSFCQNGGQCMFSQDSNKHFCICKSSYSGPRCLFLEPNLSRSQHNMEQLIGIVFSVLLVLLFLLFLLYCFAYRKCKKSASLIKSPPSETSV
ncbi:epigen [Cynoglossus semilaevis]|uniref:Epithelial mitogen homolog (mouse) n=1 Tax=Cynoglossus semilaevis TaxID=244447 RepID=A0A3P8WXH7_CYNSE|nr:epigen-like [Cynoglossus semilaevis]